MALPPEHKALLFVGAVAVLGASVRVLRATRGAVSATQPALEHQVRRADSSAQAQAERSTAATRGRGARRSATTSKNSARESQTGREHQASRAPLEHTGYIANRLDLDVATAAQIDSLPGVAPSMAKRIVADRGARGPFLSMNGLRRVSGVGPRFVTRIDSLVTFSGTIIQPTITDTVIPRAKRPRGKSR